jgi:hypothetical protein
MSFHEGSGSSKCHTSFGKTPRNQEEKVKREGQMDFCCIFIGSGKLSQIPPPGYEPEGREFEPVRARHSHQ